jgi:two-component sensor histidine kinase
VAADDKVDILLVDDQPAKLLSYEVILQDLGENLLKAESARQALEHLLRTDVAVVLMDVQMPELNGFELAAMIRDHPRFCQTAIIFVSAVHLTELDRLRGYESGAVDYVPVPVVPEILRAKVKVFAELHRKTRQLERLNGELERRVAERTAELELLVKELNHRVKNTLAVVQSIALQTGRTHLSQERFQEALGSRLQALARAHDVLTREAWEGASLAELLRQTLAPHDEAAASRVVASGPSVRLSPNAAVTLNMAFHELATNAAKYGALSNGSGRLSVTWRAEPVEDPSALELDWVERDGPAVAPPSRRGFGVRLVEQGLAHELDCAVRLAFPREGVECRIRMPLSSKVALA